MLADVASQLIHTSNVQQMWSSCGNSGSSRCWPLFVGNLKSLFRHFDWLVPGSAQPRYDGITRKILAIPHTFTYDRDLTLDTPRNGHTSTSPYMVAHIPMN
jgi:hypothetical protein